MKKIWLPLLTVAVLVMAFSIISGNHRAEAAKPAKAAKMSCKTCHADFASVLPKSHPPVKGGDLGSCTSCHKPDYSGASKKNGFAAKMHLAHVAPKGNVDCLVCHTWTPGKNFGLIGQKGSWGAPAKDDMTLMKEIFTSWAGSKYTDNLHAAAKVTCIHCHGKEFPKADVTVENATCLNCHGPMDNLAKKTEPKDFKDRNPHKSHLGEVACTICHKGHAESKVYCLGCHQKFNMKIQGGAAAK